MDKFNYRTNKDMYNYYLRKVNYLSTLRLFIFISIIVSFVIASSYVFFMNLGFIFIFFFLLLVYIHDKYYKKLNYYKNILIVIDEYKKRDNGKWRDFKDDAGEYDNQMLSDLDIIGKSSLFQYLSICKTLDGRDILIDKLSNIKINVNKLKENQEVSVELSKKFQFVLDFQVSMFVYRDRSIKLSDNFSILDKKVGNKIIDLSIGIFLSFISVLLLIFGLLNIIPMTFFYSIFIINYFINYMYSFVYHEDFDNLSKLTYSYEVLRDVYDVVISNSFDSKILKDIKSTVSCSKNSMDKLVLINDLNNFKDNILSSFIFNGLFCINIVVIYLYSLFQKSDTRTLKKGISFIPVLEALISLAGVGILRDDVVIPEISSDIKLEFNDIKHPLIDFDKCVGNDFEGECGVNIITGSNMGGKTSFLRTIGINLILMNAGTFVCSKNFKSCYFKIFTSIRVYDNIDKGISTFYAELLRIKEAMDYNEDNRLVLVDEIFKGTNYNDRIYGAINVIKKLNDDKTIIFITTHDFELCDIEVNNLDNYYFKEYYEGDNIKFDYKIRKGKCDSTNAKYLMKEIGIID